MGRTSRVVIVGLAVLAAVATFLWVGGDAPPPEPRGGLRTETTDTPDAEPRGATRANEDDRPARARVTVPERGSIRASHPHASIAYEIDELEGVDVRLPMRFEPGRYTLRAFIPGEQKMITVDVPLEAGATEIIHTEDLAKFGELLINPPTCSCRGYEGHPAWFALHQQDDGRFSASDFNGACEPPCGGEATGFDDAETTGLVMLVYLGVGETHHQGLARNNVKRGLRFLKIRWSETGSFAEDPKDIRANAIATLAITEAWGMTGSRLFKTAATDAVAQLFEARTPGKGWKRHAGDDAADIQTTAWVAMTLRSAEMGELVVPDGWRDETKRCIEGFGEPASHDVPDCAALCLARIMTGEDPKESDVLQAGLAHIVANPIDVLNISDRLDPVAAYFGTLATHAAGGKTWKRWNEFLKTSIVDNQRFPPSGEARKHGEHACGSWDALSPAARAQGRMRTTAFATLALEVYYRYGRVFGGGQNR